MPPKRKRIVDSEGEEESAAVPSSTSENTTKPSKRKLPKSFSKDSGEGSSRSGDAKKKRTTKGTAETKRKRSSKASLMSQDAEDEVISTEGGIGSSSKRVLPKSFAAGAKDAKRKSPWISKTTAMREFKVTETQIRHLKPRIVPNPRHRHRPGQLYRASDLEALLNNDNSPPSRPIQSTEASDEMIRAATLHRLLFERGGCPYPRHHVEAPPYSPKPLDTYRLELATKFVEGLSMGLLEVVDAIVLSHNQEYQRYQNIYEGLKAKKVADNTVSAILGMDKDDYDEFTSFMDTKDLDTAEWWQRPVFSLHNSIYEQDLQADIPSLLSLHIVFEYSQKQVGFLDEVLGLLQDIYTLPNLPLAAKSICGSEDFRELQKKLSLDVVKAIVELAQNT
ncbi:hypothetical protein HDU97_004799 [Phlyctochytrium planicorne]|nr:hypothetical protein HDU97_004799 [Phlyctochytrium planicorne]